MFTIQARWLVAPVVGLLGVLGWSGDADASVLMFDFGPTTVTGASQTNSPLHTAVPSFTGSTWNKVELADINSGLLYADGSAATGIALNLGSVTSGTTINLASQPSTSNALGTGTGSGIYASPSVGRDGIFTGTTGQNTRTGLQITGLAAGQYNIYVTSRNTNTGAGSNEVYTILAGAGAVGNFDSATLAQFGSNTFTAPNTLTTQWAQNQNYVLLTVTLSAGQTLNIASHAVVNGNPARGFLNSVQVAYVIPEPASLALLGLGSLCLIARRRA